MKTASKRRFKAVLTIHDENLDATLARGLKLREARIAAVHDAARRGHLFRQGAVTAAEIENGLAGFAVQQCQ